MDDILWAIEDALGEEIFERIKNAQRPSRDLVFTLRKRKDDVVLADDFQAAVLEIESLHEVLTATARQLLPKVNEEESGTHENVTSRGDAITFASIGLQEIKSPDVLRQEISRVERGNGVSVILFSNEKSSPTSSNFHTGLRKLVREFPSVKFMHASCDNFEMGLLARSLDIKCPTTLTFVKDGHRRTRGEDIDEIKDDITNALADLRRARTAPTVQDKRHPRPPPDWSEQKALAFWRMLPKSVPGILLAARMRREVRPLLLHTLPHVRTRDPDSARILEKSAVSGVCGHYSVEGETIHTCLTCDDDSPVDYCEKCYDRGQHVGHRVMTRPAPHGRCYCDCGTLANGKPLGPQCQKHKQEGDVSTMRGSGGGGSIGDMLAELLASSLSTD
ncbi:hypothetical protein EXIGLDRAFT_794902 [Exidia glandulosa HHB12029]|uniref:UBR-type domain-containing protein n=1 Tax=Exidia glandulosa HHB12029 TaxID=1314781 RepID=A0A165G7B4_EXIGL|nr:hypothetical protein EXIGLDRAFT_794902 [Exidia glandulosa HHB12029]